ncbi:MAG: flavin monoamine oxidase family protein, partial [Terriglobales bacterium]
MGRTRRDFIRYVVAGSVAAGCPVELELMAEPVPARPKVHGEENQICHQVRDGLRFRLPPTSARYDVVIVGGGISGLSAAYFLKDRDYLLLEKDAHFGGNAYVEEFEGQAYATGSAFVTEDETTLIGLAKEIGLEMLPVNQLDATIVKGELVRDVWNEGADRLPYPASVRESFKKFRRDMLAIDTEKRETELDGQRFTHYMRGYAPEIKQWWDGFGPSNWGARAYETSALIGVGAMSWVSPEDGRDTRIAWPGGNGAMSKRLAEILNEKHRERMLTGATTVAVEPQRDEVQITYVHQGAVRRVAAKAVIMAAPKFITAHLVAGIPARQKAAMQRIRYAPYPVVNLIFDKPVFRGSFDTWCPGNAFTDMIVADWTIRNRPGYSPKYNILTCYTPMAEYDRGWLLRESGCRAIARRVLRDFRKLKPEFNVDPVEVHIFRRGHPMFMSTPGTHTRLLPAARTPMERVFFANTDSEGPLSTADGAIHQAQKAVEWLDKKQAAGSRRSGAGRG